MFIDTANLSQIKEMLQFNQFEGVTTNPKLLLKEGQPRFEQLTKIRALKPGVLFVQLVGDTKDCAAVFRTRMIPEWRLKCRCLNRAIRQSLQLGIKSPMNVCWERPYIQRAKASWLALWIATISRHT